MNKPKLIYVCSPLRGNIEKNIQKAKEYCRIVIDEGHIPFAPHVAFAGILDDEIPYERELALDIGKEILKRCDEVWVFGEKPSEGMAGEIKLAVSIGIKTEKKDGI